MILLPSSAASALLNLATVQIDDALLGVTLGSVDVIYDDMTGWHSGAGVRTTLTDRPGAHGTLDGPSYRTSRPIAITGYVIAPDRASVMNAADQFAAIQADGSLGTMAVIDPDLGSRFAQIRISAAPNIAFPNERSMRFQLQFTAPDWRKYGSTTTQSTPLRTGGTGLTYPLTYPLSYGVAPSGGRLSFTNTGSAPTEPVLTVNGPLGSGFELTHIETGRRLRYQGVVGPPVVIDCAAGTVLSQGQERAMFLTVREWFSIDPGATATFTFTTLGTETASSTPTASLSVTAAPAYV